MIGSAEMYAALNKSAITMLLSSFTPSANGKALFEDTLLPESLPATATSILYYPNSPFNGALDYGQYSYSVNCRADKYGTSRTLAETVVTEINRKSYSDYYIVAVLLSTIPPQNATDNYNTPVAVTLKTRN